jgi:hypothetical protein
MKLSEISTMQDSTFSEKKMKLSDVQPVEKTMKLSDISPKTETDPGFMGTFKPWKALTQDSLWSHILQGLIKVNTLKPPTPEERQKGEEMLKAIHENPNNMVDTFKALGSFAVAHPGQFLGELANSIIADPELLAIPVGGEAGLGAKLGVTAGKIGAKAGPLAGKALANAGRIVGAGAEGAAIGAGIELGDQFATGNYDLSALKGPANFGAAMGAGGAALGKLVPGAGFASRLAKKLFGKEPELRGQFKLSPDIAASEAERAAAINKLGPNADVFGPQPGAPMEPAPKPAVGIRRLYTAGDDTNTWFTSSFEEAAKRGTPTYIDVPETGYHPPKGFKPIKDKPGMFTSALPVDSSELRPMIQPRPAIADMVKTHTPEPLKTRLQAVAKSALAGGAIGAGVGVAAQGLGGIDSGEWPNSAALGAAIGIAPRLMKAFSPRRGHDIGTATNRIIGEEAVYARQKANGLSALRESVPLVEDRNKITVAMATGAIDSLPPKLKEAALALRDAYAAFGQKALEEGELEHLRENYVPRIVESVDPNIKLSNAFSAGTKFATFQEFVDSLVGSGLKLKTMDAAELFNIYSDAMFTTLTNRRFIEALKDVRMPDGSALIVPKASRGPHYVESPSSRLSKYAVHRDIAGQLKMIFDTPASADRSRAIQQFTAATKNLAVMGSLFHVKTLLDGWIGAASFRKGQTFRPGAGIEAGINAFRKTGGQSDNLVDDFLRNGMVVGKTDDSQAHALNDIMQNVSNVVDKALPGKMSSAEGFKQLQDFNTGIHQFTFEYVQTGFKVRTALSAYERLIGKGYTHEQAVKAAASFVNDIYGGQNWVQLANSAQSDIMHRLANFMLSPSGRRMNQLLMFAPDWTVSTFRSAYKALPGAAETPELAHLHRNYMLKASISYMLMAWMLNYAAVGHSIFENKDPTKVDLGDGMKLTLSKHFMDPINILKDPVQEAANKLAAGPRAVAQFLTGKEYIGKGAPDITPWTIPGAATAAAMGKSLIPIPAQGLLSGVDPIRMAMGFLGLPESGMRPEDKAAARSASREERRRQINVSRQRREPD